MKLTISENHNGTILRSYLTNVLNLSHKNISRLKTLSNGIVLNGERVTVRAILKTGDILETDEKDHSPNSKITPVDLPVKIIYEDSRIIVVNKPPFMPTHPSHGHYDDTLANAIAFHCRDENFVFRPINRLDRDTSGAVLIAKDKHSSFVLADSMEKRQIVKKYHALLNGIISPSEGKIDFYIRRREKSIIFREATTKEAEGAQNAVTEYKTIACGKDFSLVEATPKTGRTHQLRVHFSAVGNPIVGDSLYGKSDPDVKRQALHAYYLEFIHPETKEIIKIYADYPDDFKSLLQAKGITI